jgi:hypothetical protein
VAPEEGAAEAGADERTGVGGAVFVRYGPTATGTGGTVTTAGAAATAIAAGLLAQALAPVALHPAAVVRALVTLPAEDGPGNNAPRARYRLPPTSTASASAPDAAIQARRDEAPGAGLPRFMSSPPNRR